jgi:dTDP-4-amino-4,6-dideoxygalactose transaminase
LKIPFNRVYLGGKETTYVRKAVLSGHICGDGPYTRKASSILERRLHAKKAMLTPSCTGALEMSLGLLGVGAGDEVILPSFTFSSTANAVVLRGARPVFAEIEDKTLNLDLADVEAKMTAKTKAVIPVHYAGVSCDMDRLLRLAKESGLGLVEDAAQAFGAKYRRRFLGTIGDFGCLSFHQTKNIVCGEGGALLINSGDMRVVEAAEIMREKGTDRSRFIRGEVDKYTWAGAGSSYLPSDILAAFLVAQLEAMQKIQSSRMRIWRRYNKELSPFERRGLIRRPIVPKYSQHNAHLYYVLFADEASRDAAMKGLKGHGISAVHHYIPLHSSPMGMSFGYRADDLPVTEDISGRLLRLPLFAGIKGREIDYIIDNLLEVLEELDGR